MSADVEGSADEIGAELEYMQQPPPATLFRTSDPVEVIEKATRVADALKRIIQGQQLYATIQGKHHVLVEAWTTCGAMLGLTAYCVWSRPIGELTPKGHDWEARVEVRTLDGRTLSAAEAMCARSERSGSKQPWLDRPDYALRSMAQTRATSKALRIPLGFIVTLAGYQATPAEEMPDQPEQRPPAAERASDVPSMLTPEPLPELVGESGAAEIILRATSVGIAMDDLRRAAWHKAGMPPGELQEGAFADDADAIRILAGFTARKGAELLKWVDGKAEKAAKANDGETT